MKKQYVGGMLDVTAPKAVEIHVSSDGKVVWINTEEGCVFRACRIDELLEIVDDRVPENEEKK